MNVEPFVLMVTGASGFLMVAFGVFACAIDMPLTSAFTVVFLVAGAAILTILVGAFSGNRPSNHHAGLETDPLPGEAISKDSRWLGGAVRAEMPRRSFSSSDESSAASHVAGPSHFNKSSTLAETYSVADDAIFDKLANKTRRVLEEALMPGESVHAVVNGREGLAVALTDHRIITVNGSLLRRGDDAVQLIDVAKVTSGFSAVSIGMKHGGDIEFEFWPTVTNRREAKEFVRLTRKMQARAQILPVQREQYRAESVADQLATLAQLQQQGVLTDEEFQAQKIKLLG